MKGAKVEEDFPITIKIPRTSKTRTIGINQYFFLSNKKIKKSLII